MRATAARAEISSLSAERSIAHAGHHILGFSLGHSKRNVG